MDVPFLIRGVGVLVFAYAAVSDWRHRRAPNLVWGLIAVLGATAISLEAARDSNTVAIVAGVASTMILVSAIAIGAFIQGWIGGADAKAAMVLPVIFPHLPREGFENHVFGILTQGVEVVIWVWIGAAIAGLWFTRPSVDGQYQDGIPFLVPVFVGVLGLFIVT